MQIEIRDVRLNFVNVFVARAADASKPESKTFSCSATFAKPDHPCLILPTDAEKAAGPCKPKSSMLSTVIEQVGKDKWGAKAPEILKGLRLANKALIQNGDTKAQYPGFAGVFFINSSNKSRPGVVDQNKVALAAEDGKPYSGCYGRLLVDVWAMDNQFGKRICATLGAVQFWQDGDAFGGSRVADTNDFASYEEGADAADLV